MAIQVDCDAFVRMLTECQSRLYAYILILLPDYAAANDVLAETNSTLWRKSADFQMNTDFAAWAMRVAYFEVLAFQKRRRTDRHVFSGELLLDVAETAAESSQDFGDRRLALRGCLGKLASHDRELVNLRYQSGMQVQDIATRRGKSANAISQALFRVRTTLAGCIERALRMESNR